MERGRSVLVVLFGCAWMVAGPVGPLYAQRAANGSAAAGCPADLTARLAGTWRAPQYRMKRTSEVGVQVFGADAFDIREVELTLEPSGEGLLKISTSVVDEKKRTWAPTLVEARIAVGAVEPGPAGRCEPSVKVTSAEEQYLDDTKYKASMNGARVALLTDPKLSQLDLRFETPSGEGSFWTTMSRQRAR